MKRKRVKKLHLKAETVRSLVRSFGGGTSYGCNGGDTLWDTCTEPLPVPSVDACGTNAAACGSLNPPGCVSGYFSCDCRW